MLTNRIPRALFTLAIVLALLPGFAPAQTSVSASVYGAFNGTTSANGIQQSPANQAGGLFELRHISNPVLGLEATYSINRADQTYKAIIFPPACPAPCGPYIESLKVPANAHEITANWVPSLHIANVRPFGVLGVGLLLNVPSGNQTATTTNGAGAQTTSTATNDASTTTTAVYVYGAGLDWGLLPHIGLRLQYRGNLYKAPDLTKLYTSTDSFTHTAEPMIGIYFRL
jgi:opacity protein-like surface antigen